MLPPRRRWAEAAVLAALLVAAYIVPPLAVIGVWPLLFALPGAALLGWAESRGTPRLAAPARIGLAVVISVALSAHLAWWIGLAVGYDRASLFGAAALLGLLWLLRPTPRAGPAASRGRSALALVRRHAGGVLVAALAAAAVGVTLGVSLWRVDAQGVSSGGSNWSDLGVHLSIAQSVNAGNFPPEVPFFAGVPLVYHWFADLHVATLALAAGIFSADAMVFQSTLLSAALALIVYGLGLRLFADRRTAALAAAFAVFAGGMGWIRLVADVWSGAGTPLELIARNSYDNQWLTDWPYFRIPSVMGTGLLVHRATTAGLPMLAGAMLLLAVALPHRRRWRAGLRDRPRLLLLAGLLGAMLAPFHFFYFPAVLLLALGYVLAADRLRDAATVRNAALFLAPFGLALPFALQALDHAAGTGTIRQVWGWESAPRDDGREAVVFFYLTNLGIPFLLALAALVTPRLPHRLFLGGWVLALFAIPNLVQVSEIGFDMNKYFQAMWIVVALLAAWLVRAWPPPALALMLALSVPSPLLAAAWTATSDLQVLSRDELEAARWAAAETPPRSVFVTDGWLNSLTDPAGRLRLLTFEPYVANLGYSPTERAADVRAIYCGGDAGQAAELMRRHRASYVVDSARPADCSTPTLFDNSPRFRLAFANRTVRIWELVSPGTTWLDGLRPPGAERLLSFRG